METIDIFNTLKHDLLEFGKVNYACEEEYGRLLRASSIPEVIEVVMDNFFWCGKYMDFVNIVIANKELFEEYRIFANQDVKISDGVAYLCVSEGEFDAMSYGSSMIIATSLGTSTIFITSKGISTINAMSYGSSMIIATSRGTSMINVTSRDNSTISATSWDTSTINATSWNTSKINIMSYDFTKISAMSRDTSMIYVTSHVASIINAISYDSSTINVESWDTSTLIIRTPTIECKVNDCSIVRYIYDNHIVVAGDWLTVEKR